MGMLIWREQMKIEIAEPGRMTQTGSSLLKLIQNNNMPVLDLLVRESIQNSLDAKKVSSKYVEVEYLTGTFKGAELNQELEGVTEALNKKYADTGEFIAVKDSNTVGLTGEMNYKKVVNNDYGNLLKLVYEICKPQDAEGAGGSWGLGKTVYFRIGIGIVIYYSRIQTEDGVYQSRLVASFVEDETKADSMIPVYKGQSKRGICWWGEAVGENITQPVTDEAYIERFLKIFNIETYKDKSTGTMIIIPYVDHESLLSSNQVEYLNAKEERIVPFWNYKLEDYLRISAQRWYAPRFSNPYYTYGPYLRFTINGNGIGRDDMEPVFKVVQGLYNRAFNNVDDILNKNNVEVAKPEEINIRNVLTEQKSGMFSFAKVNKKLLGMDAPFNKPNPFIYFNCEHRDANVNKPVVCYTRQPGMIVSYDNDGPWVPDGIVSGSDEFIVGIFVLYSYNKVKGYSSVSSLEEYIRRSEMADHTSWSDWSEGSTNSRIVNRIQMGVEKKLAKEYSVSDPVKEVRQNSGLGKLFGDMLLPPENDKGKRPISEPNPEHGPSVRRGVSFVVEDNKIQYKPSAMVVPINIIIGTKAQTSKVGFEMTIDSDSKKIEMSDWENKMSLETPFSISEMKVYIEFFGKEKADETINIEDGEDTEWNGVSFAKLRSANGTWYGLNIIGNDNLSIKMKIICAINIKRNDVVPAFVFKKGDDVK